MRLRLFPLVLLAVLFLAPAAFAQTNPCANPVTAGVLNPTTIFATLADYNTLEVDGTNRLVGVKVSQFLSGTDVTTGTPVQSTDVPRASWSLVTGTADCYRTQLPSAPLSAGLSYFAVLKSLGQASASLWSDPSNPFGPTGTPGRALTVSVTR